MKGITEYIVSFEKTHRDTITEGDATYSVNPNFEQPKHINRIGKVIAVPSFGKNEIKVGYEVLVIHTVLLNEVYEKTGTKKSHFCIDIEKNYFRFEPNLIVMYRENKNENWRAHLNNVMVMPIEVAKEKKEWNGYEIPETVFEKELGYKGNETQKGVIAFANDTLKSEGVFEGDTVIFKEDREYEFEIDGKIYYHMENVDLILYKSNFIKTEYELEDAFI